MAIVSIITEAFPLCEHEGCTLRPDIIIYDQNHGSFEASCYGHHFETVLEVLQGAVQEAESTPAGASMATTGELSSDAKLGGEASDGEQRSDGSADGAPVHRDSASGDE